jgi:hypothetical protein
MGGYYHRGNNNICTCAGVEHLLNYEAEDYCGILERERENQQPAPPIILKIRLPTTRPEK